MQDIVTHAATPIHEQKDMSVEKLVAEIRDGEIKLPEMQRRFVWSKVRVRDFLDSLYHGYPSGNILMWQHQGGEESVVTRQFAVAQKEGATNFRLLLDGQQRLTSLSSVLRGEPVYVKGRKTPIEILFNLEHPEISDIVTEVREYSDADDDDLEDDQEDFSDGESRLADTEDDEDTADATDDEMMQRFKDLVFVVENRRLKDNPQWVKVSDIFKANDVADILVKLGYNDLNHPTTQKYHQRLQRVRKIANYKYRVDVLDATLSYPQVTEIFVRVNSLGVKLRGSDLALAQVTAIWRGSLKKFSKYQDKCAKDTRFDLDLGVHLRNLVICATGQSRFNGVKSLSRDTLRQNWKFAKNSMDCALTVLGQNFSIESSALLSSPFLILVVAYFVHKNGLQLSPEEKLLLRKWVMLANAKGRYARGSGESILDEDLRAIRENKGEQCLNELIHLLDRQVGRLEIIPTDLEGRNRRSALFKAMFLLFHSKGATDWHDGLQISTTSSKTKHALQFHHIFPRKVLDGKYSIREINDIGNLAFISGKTNLKISGNEPSKYLPPIVDKHGEKVLTKQCVPTNPALWSVSAYHDFLSERRALISRELNEFVVKEHWRD